MPVTPSRRVVRPRRLTPVEGLERRTLFAAVVVNSLLDTTGTAGVTTLRDAVATADAATTATTITFDPTLFATAKTIQLTGTALSLSNNQVPTTITGPAAGVTINGGGQSGIFAIVGSVHATLTGLTLTNASGRAISNLGILTLTDSSITNSVASDTMTPSGAGLFNGEFATATVDGVTFSGNTAFFGAGVDAGGTISIVNSTFNRNTAIGDTGIYAANAGGLSVSGTATVTNDTFTDNNGNGGNAIAVTLTGQLTLSDSTIADNGNATGILNAGVARNFTLGNTIVAGNGTIDADGTFNSHGNNLIGSIGGSTGWATSDLTGTTSAPIDPLLGPLADNGGPTKTRLPAEGSPALNAGSVTVIPVGITTDQRGQARTVNGTVDIGSVEVPKAVTVTTPGNQTAVPLVAKTISLGSFTTTGVNGPFTVTVAWGDGSSSTTLSMAASGTISPVSHTFPSAATDTVTVTVADVTGMFTGSTTFTVTVAPLPAIAVTAPTAAQTAVIATSTSIALGSFTATNTPGPYTVTVNWGDNTTASTFTVTSAGTIPATSHAFATSGTDTVTVTVSNADASVTNSATFGVTVTTGTTASSVALASSTTSPTSGDAVTLTATVSPAAATGVVTFESNGTVVGQVAVANGVASLTTTTLVVGVDSIVAVYSGDTTYATSTAPTVVVTVLSPPATTATTLTASATAITTSQSVTLTATITSPSTTPTSGDVTFFQSGTALGTVSVSSAGVAVLTTTSSLLLGTDVITATYLGNTNFLTSASASVSILVSQTTTDTTLTVSSDSKTIAQPLTLTANIGPATITPTTLAAVAPTGTVTFAYSGTVIGTAAVGANGVATLTTTAVLPLGISQIGATYDGDASFSASGSTLRNVSVTQHALVPTILSIATPDSAIGGVRVRGQVRVSLSNQLSGLQAGDETGSYSVTVYASPTTTFDPSNKAVASVVKSNKIRAGKSATVTVPITALPATLADGTYHVLVVTTDSAGNQEVVDTGKVVAVTAPTVSLSATFLPLTKNAGKTGATITLTDNGNAEFTTTLTATIGITTTPDGATLLASTAGTVRPVKVTLRPGRPTKIKLSGWQSIYAGLPIGSYYFTVTITDNAGHTASAVSTTTVSKLTTA